MFCPLYDFSAVVIKVMGFYHQLTLLCAAEESWIIQINGSRPERQKLGRYQRMQNFIYLWSFFNTLCTKEILSVQKGTKQLFTNRKQLLTNKKPTSLCIYVEADNFSTLEVRSCFLLVRSFLIYKKLFFVGRNLFYVGRIFFGGFKSWTMWR